MKTFQPPDTLKPVREGCGERITRGFWEDSFHTAMGKLASLKTGMGRKLTGLGGTGSTVSLGHFDHKASREESPRTSFNVS